MEKPDYKMLFIVSEVCCPVCNTHSHTDKYQVGEKCTYCKKDGIDSEYELVEMSWWDGDNQSARRYSKKSGKETVQSSADDFNSRDFSDKAMKGKKK